MEYADHIQRLAQEDPLLARELTSFTSLEHVLPWLAQKGLPLDGLDVLAQDEYSHDLLLPLPDGRCLSFGMT
jgi:hypothetical protein